MVALLKRGATALESKKGSFDEVELDGIKFAWAEPSKDPTWLRVSTTRSRLSCLLDSSHLERGEEKRRKEKEQVKYVLEKLEGFDLLEWVNEGDSKVSGGGEFRACFYLKLDVGNLEKSLSELNEKLGFASLETSTSALLSGQSDADDTNALVQRVRQQMTEVVYRDYGRVRVFGILEPVNVLDIYTETDVWRETIHLVHPSLSERQSQELLYLGRDGRADYEPKRHAGLDVAKDCPRLIVLGKPGIGKTTYLQYLAVQCIKGNFQPNKVPFLVRLSLFGKVARQDTSQDKLLNFICSALVDQEIPEETIRSILEAGTALILLDGLDEVSASEDELVVTEIRQFIHQYPGNSFLISCRVAARKYKFALENFTEIEVADFNIERAEVFIQLWFKALLENQPEPINLAEALTEALKQPKNRATQELATTPLLLNLICLVFCDTRTLPTTRCELYQRGVSLLLKEWDQHRGVCRDSISLSKLREGRAVYLAEGDKLDLLLHLARTTFDQSNIIFEEQQAQAIVLQFLQRSNLAPDSPVKLDLDSLAILHLIALNHGLLVGRAPGEWSFSHLTFHEYFVARSIHLFKDWQALLPHLCDSHWHEVFLLVAEMQLNADDADRLICCIEQQLQAAFSCRPELQRFLEWVDQLADQVAKKVSYKLPALRVWYFSLNECNLDKGVETFRRSGQADEVSQAIVGARVLELDVALLEDLLEFDRLYKRLYDALSLVSEEKLANDLVEAFNRFDKVRRIDILLPAFLAIKEVLLPLDNLDFPPRQHLFIDWWRQAGASWASKLLAELQSSDPQANEVLFQSPLKAFGVEKDVLTQFYDANLLLVSCMRRAQHLTPTVQAEVEAALLLPNKITKPS